MEPTRPAMDASTSKRARSHSDSDGSSSSPEASTKIARAVGSSLPNQKLICTLPPTCSPPTNGPSYLTSTAELEKHYALFHAHVCEVKGCNCVFPEGRFLELHFSECHDPLNEMRKERGERTFECFLPRSACSRTFLNPKSRRRHLIEAHQYPKEYFFAVTNKGIGGLLKKWGEGASLVRGKWTPREATNEETGSGAIEEEEEANHELMQEDNNDRDGFHAPGAGEGATPLMEESGDDEGMAEIASGLQSLALVPNKIRFGRGGRSAGFSHRGNETGTRTKVANQTVDASIVQDGNYRERNSDGRQRHTPSDIQHTDHGNGTGLNFVPISARRRGRGKLWVP